MVNEISFNSIFIPELKAFAFVQKLLHEEGIEGIQTSRLGQLRFHAIDAAPELAKLRASSKLNNEPVFLDHLFSIGCRAADGWRHSISTTSVCARRVRVGVGAAIAAS